LFWFELHGGKKKVDFNDLERRTIA
jgi:hypothetical protein